MMYRMLGFFLVCPKQNVVVREISKVRMRFIGRDDINKKNLTAQILFVSK